ncbi:uncharacterized protein [Amphiura filiformis]|uniref:uncharacterized protein n=1 Tax=Amphiura filiformis TaxID=82378 RepID=UPI003B223064
MAVRFRLKSIIFLLAHIGLIAVHGKTESPAKPTTAEPTAEPVGQGGTTIISELNITETSTRGEITDIITEVVTELVTSLEPSIDRTDSPPEPTTGFSSVTETSTRGEITDIITEVVTELVTSLEPSIDRTDSPPEPTTGFSSVTETSTRGEITDIITEVVTELVTSLEPSIDRTDSPPEPTTGFSSVTETSTIWRRLSFLLPLLIITTLISSISPFIWMDWRSLYLHP